MKTLYPVVGAVLLAAAVFLAVKGGSDERPATDRPDPSASGKSTPAAPAPSTRPRPAPPSEASRGSETPAAARELELLWARGRAGELLPALDRLSAEADQKLWGDVGPVLIEQAAKEGRPEVAAYLLATGDAAPAGIRLEIYAAAMDNRDEGTRATARLELENITGKKFASGEEARAWIAANPQATADEQEEEPADQ
jgi:hypothetical protein